MYSPYDFNQSIAHRAEYVEERLKGGSPVVGLSYDRGVLLFTVKRTQRKIFEIYDQLMYSAIGNQTDVEAVRLAAIDFAHAEGFQRGFDNLLLHGHVGPGGQAAQQFRGSGHALLLLLVDSGGLKHGGKIDLTACRKGRRLLKNRLRGRRTCVVFSGWWLDWDVSKVGFDWRRRRIAFDKPARDGLAPSLFLGHKQGFLGKTEVKTATAYH